jgi:hypothetical protein
MSARYEWLAAAQVEVGGSARPDYVVGSDGEGNAVAVITLTNRHTGDGAVIEGRPEDLLNLARAMVRTAEQIVEVTMRDPNLRSLYGLTGPAAPLSQGGTSGYVLNGRDITPDTGPHCGMVDDGFTCTRSPDGHTLHAAGNGLILIAVWEGSARPDDADVCYRQRQHVRSTRHTRLECPYVTEVDADYAS